MFNEGRHASQPEKEKDGTMKWVDLISFDAAARKGSMVVRAILENGIVHLEGNAAMTETLRKDGVFSSSARRTVTPEDGEAFLKALGEEYRNAHFFATDVREGEKPVAYEAPPMKDVPRQEKDKPTSASAA